MGKEGGKPRRQAAESKRYLSGNMPGFVGDEKKRGKRRKARGRKKRFSGLKETGLSKGALFDRRSGACDLGEKKKRSTGKRDK